MKKAILPALLILALAWVVAYGVPRYEKHLALKEQEVAVNCAKDRAMESQALSKITILRTQLETLELGTNTKVHQIIPMYRNEDAPEVLVQRLRDRRFSFSGEKLGEINDKIEREIHRVMYFKWLLTGRDGKIQNPDTAQNLDTKAATEKADREFNEIIGFQRTHEARIAAYEWKDVPDYIKDELRLQGKLKYTNRTDHY